MSARHETDLRPEWREPRKRGSAAGWLASRAGATSWQWRLPAGATRTSVLVTLAIVVVLAGIVHIVSILGMPTLALRNAYRRLSAVATPNEMVMLPGATASETLLPLSDPAFLASVCLYDLSRQPLKVRVPATADYTSVSFYTEQGLGYYALSDQAAGRVIELDLMTLAQRAALPEDEEITSADRLVIASPSTKGIVLVRAFARDRDMREVVRHQLEAATCAPSPS